MSNHARKKVIDIEDIRLAVNMYNEQNFSSPPTRDVLLESARNKNANPLPPPKPSSGLRLPPDRFCLTAANFRLKPKQKPRPNATYTIRGGAKTTQSRQVLQMNPGIMPRIQIQPSGGNAPTTFTMTVNPMKRKADE